MIDSLKSIIVDGMYDEEYNFDKVDEVEELTIKNTNIGKFMIDKINKMSNLKSLSFYNCEFDSDYFINVPISKLVLNNIENFSYGLIDNDNITELYLDNLENIDLNMLKNIRRYKTISFENTKIESEENIFYLISATKINLSNTGIKDISLLLSLENLEYLVIDEEISLNNKEFIIALIKNNVKVVNNYNQSVEIYYEG